MKIIAYNRYNLRTHSDLSNPFPPIDKAPLKINANKIRKLCYNKT